MTAMTTVYPTLADIGAVERSPLKLLLPVEEKAEPDPVADMQTLWRLYLATGHVKWCHALTARKALYDVERFTDAPFLPTLRPEDEPEIKRHLGGSL